MAAAGARRVQAQRGFTLVEMLVVCAMLSVISLAIYPLAELSQQRQHERELRAALNEIRVAIDAYKAQHDRLRHGRPAIGTGYPPHLQALLTGFVDPESGQAAGPVLRRIPRDPFAPPGVPADATWGLRSFASPAHSPRPGPDVYDVRSLSQRQGLNGIALGQW